MSNLVANLVTADQPPALADKAERLARWFEPGRSVLVAFSGGVDSALVAYAAVRMLGPDRVRSVIADSPSLPRRELEAALAFSGRHGIPLEIVPTGELNRPGYVANDGDRCYHCKQELYTVMEALDGGDGAILVLNGTNAEDPGEWRPGLAAAEEHRVRSPLLECGFTKEDVRELSRSLGLETWDKPALPCLASRIPYGREVTPERLEQIEAAENVLWEAGFRVFRVRHYGPQARVEMGLEERQRMEDQGLRGQISEGIIAAGFESVVFDEEPYRRGRLNEELEGSPHPDQALLGIRKPSDRVA